MGNDGDVAMHPRVFCVLMALAQGDSHGLGIAKSVEEITAGSVVLSPGTLYPLIHKLLLDGWIGEIDDAAGDPRRRCYRLLTRGRRAAQAEAERLDGLVRHARTLKLLAAGARP
jgi:PadR family transcriptional regulator PadR